MRAAMRCSRAGCASLARRALERRNPLKDAWAVQRISDTQRRGFGASAQRELLPSRVSRGMMNVS